MEKITASNAPIRKGLAHWSLTYLIRSSFDLHSSSEEFQKIFGLTISYLTGVTKAFDFQAQLKPFCKGDMSAKDFRLKLVDKEYLSLRLKFYVFRLLRCKLTDAKALLELKREYMILNSDIRNVQHFFKTNHQFRLKLRLRSKGIKDNIHLNLKVVRAALKSCLEQIEKKLKSTTYKRLRFICRSQNLDLIDLQNDLTIKVVQAFYKLMPSTMSMAHVINYLKVVANNHAINTIYANTSLRRGRQINTAEKGSKVDKFKLIVTSENQMRPLSMEDDNRTSYDELLVTDPTSELELKFSIKQLLVSLKPGSKKQKLLLILMGNEDQGFTDWLRAKKHINQKESNYDLQSRASVERFNILVGLYLNLSEEKTKLVLDRVSRALALDNPKTPKVITNVNAKSSSSSFASVSAKGVKVDFRKKKYVNAKDWVAAELFGFKARA